MKNLIRKTGIVIGTVVAIAVASVAAGVYWAASGRLTPEEYERGFVHVSADASEGHADGRYTIVTYNIGYASGLTGNTGYNASAEEYEENLAGIGQVLQAVSPDFVAFQEIDYDSDRAYHHDQLAILADDLGMKYRAQAFNWDKRYVPWPYWPLSGHFGQLLSGQALSSRFPVRKQAKVTLPMPAENPFWYNAFYLDRIVQIAEVDVGGEMLVVMNLHLDAYHRETREAQGAIVADLARQYAAQPVIILGDFNSELPWRAGDERTLSNVLAAKGLQSAIPEEAFRGEGARKQLTAPSDTPQGSIDHILYNERIECLSARVIQDAGTGADHFPVVMEFKFRR